MAHNNAINRLTREYKKLESSPVDNILALPDPKNLFEWHFLIYGLKDSVYSDGFYHGKIIFPLEYPHKPPKIKFITPSGRFKTNEEICLSFTNFHPESWNPTWTIETMLVGLISFMNTEENTTGSIRDSSHNRRILAKKSLMFNLQNDDFVRVFKPYFSKLGISTQKAEENLAQAESQSISEDGTKKSLFLFFSILVIFISYAIIKILKN